MYEVDIQTKTNYQIENVIDNNKSKRDSKSTKMIKVQINADGRKLGICSHATIKNTDVVSMKTVVEYTRSKAKLGYDRTDAKTRNGSK